MSYQKPTLLIVEDDDNDFLFLERALGMENFEANIRRACDGVEAIEYLAGENDFANREAHPLPHLILLDLKMPRRNGFEVLEWLREHSELETLPVVVFSSSEEPALRFLRAGDFDDRRLLPTGRREGAVIIDE